ncbi:TIGR03364 family FAD-dependent oxidoreductase [Novosphingobium percolationis]|uniref:TIGR03364 family FAD-dependent oxidoreductase n=1 Tax=Novosphingobium percolationis TaxID=2871811 RepID=UPI001CD671BE|nr:TIGR03364 family FAD-dependent oxidoreductase [Novosphingobium percolationis]
MTDLIVIGAGIVGLAHALAAARRGKRVTVIDRDAHANGASIRNFGFVTVTGQQRGQVWQRARRSARIWREVAAPAGIRIEQEGLLMAGQRAEAGPVLDAFMDTEMAEGCTRLTAAEAQDLCPRVSAPAGAILSSADLRVESREALPRLAAWLAQAHGVTFRFGAAAVAVEPGRVALADGTDLRAEAIVVCPGDDWATLFPAIYAGEAITRCKLQMLRLAAPGWQLPAPVMSDLSLIRYLGYAELPEAAALRARLEAEEPEALGWGIHLIAVQSADGTLVVGDSHEYGPTPDPFSRAAIDAAMLRQYAAVLGPPPAVVERWTGTYASAAGHSIVRAPADGVRLVVVTSGTGASTGFALGEEVIADLFGKEGTCA